MRPALLLSCPLVALLACGGPSDAPAAAPPVGSGGPTQQARAAAALSIERLDASAECDGLVPDAPPAPVVVHRIAPAGGTCLGGTSDGTGAVALGLRASDGGVGWQAFAADGRPQGAFSASPLLSQPRGWHGLATDASGAVRQIAVAPDGGAAAATVVSPDPTAWTGFRAVLAADPQGGSFALLRAVTIAGNHWHSVFARRFDAAGAPRAADAARLATGGDASEPWFMGAGVSTAGEALALVQDSAFLDAIWVDAGGAIVASGTQQEPSAGVVGDGLRHDVDSAALLDGSIAVRSDGTWRRRYERLATASSPLPGWLAERASWGVRITRGNLGYAALEAAGQPSPSCAQRIELVAPSGRLCGRITLSEEGTGCTTGALDQGWDGTVVQQSGTDPCTARFWPRLLAR